MKMYLHDKFIGLKLYLNKIKQKNSNVLYTQIYELQVLNKWTTVITLWKSQNIHIFSKH